MIRKKIFNYFLYWILVILPIYQDSFLYKYFGSTGNSLLPAFSLVFIFFYILLNQKIIINSSVIFLCKLGIWLTIVSFFAVVIWAILGNSLNLYGEFLPYKAVKVCLLYFSYPAYVYLLLCQMKKLNLREILFPFFVVLIILTIICLIELRQIPYALESLHFSGGFPYYRVRLLTKEASWTTLLIYNYFAISFIYAVQFNKKIIGILSILCFAVLILTTGSKAVMFSMILSVGLYFFISMERINKKTLIKLFIALILAFLVIHNILPKFITNLQTDIKEYTSFATRSYTIIIGFIIGIIFPTGVGGGVYLGVLPSFMNRFIDILNKSTIRLSSSEIMHYINNTASDTGLTAKSGILQYNIYWGIIGIFALGLFFINLSKKINRSELKTRDLLKIVYWCNILLILTSLSFSYEFWLLIAVVIYIGDHMTLKNHNSETN